jgi:signal transduction histidine kinase
MWEENPDSTVQDVSSSPDKWINIKYGDEPQKKPVGIYSAWVRFKLPDLNWARPTLYIKELSAKDVTIFINNEEVYENHRNYPYNKNKLLLYLDSTESNKEVYMFLNSEADWLGLQEQLVIGEYYELSKGFMKREMLDIVLGASLVFISLSMLVVSIFLNKSALNGWNSLCVVILSVGLMIISYSPFLHSVYSDFGWIAYYSFDIATNLLFPALFIFFERIFGKGPFNLISRFRKIQIVLVSFAITCFFIGFLSDLVKEWYAVIGFVYFGISIVVGSVILTASLIVYCKKGNREAIILTFGYGIFATVAIVEITWLFIKGMNYNMFFWKWGVLCFIVSLIIILVRRILQNYEQVVKYSKQLEIFNNEFQRSEKMDIISQLAASVAHEVRNPLQVTRGFLQLLGEKTANNKDKTFMVLAIDELDRASEIITDFLTFAKPQLENTTLLNIGEELHQIEGILIPLAIMNGGIIKTEISSNLYIKGNSSKLKQALINIIKNSIEALGEEGEIIIKAYQDINNEIVIKIKDNGEGMSEADLERLGEPYYSKKTKGTGLGLMVTFRIIEVMNGRISFVSNKGIGTEAIIHFPIEKK